MDRIFGLGIGRAYDLSGAQSPAGKQHTGRLGPVVAPHALGIGRKTRRAAELAHGHHHDPLVQASLVNVFDERREGLVQVGQADPHVLGKMAGSTRIENVIVPIGELLTILWCIDGETDDTGPRFRQSPGQQATLSPRMPAVTIP